MSLDVEIPPPPELQTGDHGGGQTPAAQDRDYHRDDLEAFLANGAWERAFRDWADRTDLDREAFAIVEDLGLFAQFDFFWDDFAGRVGFSAPGLPEDWRERDLHPDLDSWGTVSNVNASMTELGRAVADLLTTEYVDWDEEYEAPDDLPDF